MTIAVEITEDHARRLVEVLHAAQDDGGTLFPDDRALIEAHRRSLRAAVARLDRPVRVRLGHAPADDLAEAGAAAAAVGRGAATEPRP